MALNFNSTLFQEELMRKVFSIKKVTFLDNVAYAQLSYFGLLLPPILSIFFIFINYFNIYGNIPSTFQIFHPECIFSQRKSYSTEVK